MTANSGFTGYGLRVEVWAKGGKNWAWWSNNLNFLPRVGEFIHFNDGRGVVESVEWLVPGVGENDGDHLLIKVTCVPE